MNMAKLFILFLILISSSVVHSKEIAGVNFDELITIADVPSALKMNGMGIRYKFFFKIYIAVLYVQEKAHQADKLMASSGAKRMVMHILYDEVDKQKLIDGWLRGFEANLSKTDFLALKPKIDKFNTLFETLKSGDSIFLDSLPNQGTRVIIKGQLKGMIGGQEFYPALLKIWLGNDPISSDLKEELLAN